MLQFYGLNERAAVAKCVTCPNRIRKSGKGGRAGKRVRVVCCVRAGAATLMNMRRPEPKVNEHLHLFVYAAHEV